MIDDFSDYDDQVEIPPHLLRGKLRKLILTEAPEYAIEFMQKHLKDFYTNCRPAVRTGILSLQFIQHLKKQ